MSVDLQPLLLTFTLAAVTTLLLLLIGIPLACWIAYAKTRAKPLVEALVAMPLVLPPTVLGFYLLLAFSPQYAFGHWLEQYFHLRLVFSFSGLVIGSVIFSLPFMVQPLQSALQNLPPSLLEASRTLGQSDLRALFRVLLKQSGKRLPELCNYVAGHSLGEFSALVSAKSLSFEDGLKLVIQRANAMQRACESQPSTMAAINRRFL